MNQTFTGLLGQIRNIVREIATLALALVVMVILVELLGFHVPFFNVRESGSNLAWILAACAYCLGSRI